MRRGPGRALALACAALAGTGAALAQPVAAPGAIYRCVGPEGRLVTRDRQMTDCVGPQYFVNPDGSNSRVVLRPATEEEREEAERKQREAEAAQRATQVQARADLALLRRYPDKAAHDKARQAALDSAHAEIVRSDARIAELMRSRKPLIDETEFYAGKPLPTKLKTAIDANDAMLAGQRSIRQNQEDEVQRIDKNYDAELAHLTKLWSAKPTR
jgi:hypothetical protein